MKRDNSSERQQQRDDNHQQTVVQRKIDNGPDHFCSTAFWKMRALAITRSPALSPDLTSCMLPGSMLPPTTSTRRNELSCTGMYTHSRSCKCRIADVGTVACVSLCAPWKIAVTNMPKRIRPCGFSTSRRTFVVRIFGSRIGRIL